MRRALVIVLSAAIIVGIYATWTLTRNRPGSPGADASRADRFANFILYETPETRPRLSFVDASGKQRTLDELRGKVLLVNFWATWCAPCREEMPALDRLQAKLGGPAFQVVPVSLDRTGMERVLSFLRREKIANLAPYLDHENASLAGFQLLGLPTTVLIGRDGRELGRLVGPAKWDSPQAMAFLERFLTPADAP